LSAQKGYEFFVQAAACVLKQTQLVRFAIAGEGEEREKLHRLIQRLGLADRFSLLGFCWNVGTILASFDLFVSSSLWEGLPLAVLEAMQVGKPIICTPPAVPPELCNQEKGVLVVPAGDPEQLAEAILALARDPQRRQAMAVSALQASSSIPDQDSICNFDQFAAELALSDCRSLPMHKCHTQ
jgi:glycosyltransferase involved in cell wall biosynthesis